MADPLGTIETQLQGSGRRSQPPLEQWNPPLSGDIDIVIRADGEWTHEGSIFRRRAIVDLFSTILRRETDGDYYLVTPVEKWRISVEAHALQVIDISRDPENDHLIARLNHGPDIIIGEDHPLCPSEGSDVPWLACRNGLSAALSRSVWYRLVDDAVEQGGTLIVNSGTWRYALGPAPAP